MFTLLVTLRLIGGEVVTLPVVDSTQTDLTFAGCMSVQGQLTAMHFAQEHYPDATMLKYACRIGNKQAPKEGGA